MYIHICLTYTVACMHANKHTHTHAELHIPHACGMHASAYKGEMQLVSKLFICSICDICARNILSSLRFHTACKRSKNSAAAGKIYTCHLSESAAESLGFSASVEFHHWNQSMIGVVKLHTHMDALWCLGVMVTVTVTDVCVISSCVYLALAYTHNTATMKRHIGVHTHLWAEKATHPHKNFKKSFVTDLILTKWFHSLAHV